MNTRKKKTAQLLIALLFFYLFCVAIDMTWRIYDQRLLTQNNGWHGLFFAGMVLVGAVLAAVVIRCLYRVFGDKEW